MPQADLRIHAHRGRVREVRESCTRHGVCVNYFDLEISLNNVGLYALLLSIAHKPDRRTRKQAVCA